MKRRAYFFAIYLTIIAILVVCGAPPLYAGKTLKGSHSYDVIFSEGQPRIDLPVNSAEQAVQHAVDKRLLDMPDYEYVQNAIDWEVNWVVSAVQQEGMWRVYIKTQNVIPSYSCGMIFNDQKEIEIKPCGWNK